MPTLNINGNIRVDTVANWTSDATIYSGKTILISSDSLYTGTDQRKFKIADGVQTWANLDYFPDVNALIATIGLAQVLAISNLTGNQWIFSDSQISGALIDDNGVYLARNLGDDFSEINLGALDSTMGFTNATKLGFFRANGTYCIISHTDAVQLSAPNINLPNETASRLMYLDASKNIKTKTNAQVLSDIGAQPLDTQLTEIASLNPANDDIIQEKAGVLTNRTMAQLGADLTASNLIGYQGYVVSADMAQVSPADGTTYYYGSIVNIVSSVDGDGRLSIPKTGTIKAIYITVTNQGTTGSAETSSISFRLNQTTDTLITSSFVTNASVGVFSNTGLNISVTAGDTYEIKWVTPNWVTNPTALRMKAQIYIE